MHAAEILLPGALAGPQIDRSYAAAMTGGKDPVAVEYRPAADIGKARDGIDTASVGEVVRPQRPAIFDCESVKLARRIRRHNDLAIDRGARIPEKACCF